MGLPKIDRPQYETTLPSSGKTVTYHPYLRKEAKLLMMAAQTKNEREIHDAIIRMIESCCQISTQDLEYVDVEWLYAKLVSCSESPTQPISFKPDQCNEEGCPKILTTQINLDKIYVKSAALDLEKIGFVKGKNGVWRLPITDTIGIELKRRVSNKETEDEILFDCLESVYDEHTLHTKDQYTLEQFKSFLDEIPLSIVAKLIAFLNFRDAIACDVNGKCPKCKRTFTDKATGIYDFFV